MNYTSNIFKYSGYTYTLLVNIYTSSSNKDDDICVSFDANDIEEVVYEGKLNDLLLKGHVIYTDKYAAVDKLMNAHYCYCDIMFAQNIKESDNGDGMANLDKEKRFFHTFIVTNIKVIARMASIIKYQIDLSSINWFNCAANVDFSNYGYTPQPIFDIIKSCIVNNKLQIDDESFNRVKAPVQINYISQRNDNLFTAVNYLMHKLYYDPMMRDDSMKFIVYDQFLDKYRLLDIKDQFTLVGAYSTILSFFKTNTEAMIQQEPTNIGAFRTQKTKQYLYSDMFDKHMFGYDYNYDMLIDTYIQSEEIATYMNTRIDNADYEPKYKKMFQFPNMKHEYAGMYWDNQLDVYNESILALEENNSLILNIAGEIRRQCGSLNNVILDRSLENITSDFKKELEKMKKKYKAYEGVWIASKVRSIICPQKPSFRQQVALFRNFIPKLKST